MSNDKSQPLISIVTVCYNAVSTIEETIISVINQSYDNIEYIIIDGGSKDGTIDLIEKYADKISYWISEPDMGIYDAMNKGIAVATGKWINFMNSGDYLFNDHVLEIFVLLLPFYQGDIFYGDTALNYRVGLIQNTASSIDQIMKRLPFCHQSCFVLTDLLKRKKYNLSYRICADYDFFYNEFLAGKSFCYIPLTIAIYEAETGLSAKHALKSFKEMGLINGRFSKLQWKIEYLFFALRLRLYYWAKILIPQEALSKRRNSKYKFISQEKKK